MYSNYKPQNEYQLVKTRDDDKKCILKFSKCDNKYPLSKLSSEDLKEFVKTAKLLESLSWSDIKFHRSLNYEALDTLKPPNNISNDIILHSMRMSKKSRLIGYREKEFFNIVWFDNRHQTC